MSDKTPENNPSTSQPPRQAMTIARKALFTLLVFAAGMVGGYLIGRNSVPVADAGASTVASRRDDGATAMIHQINPPEGYTLPAKYGDIGPKMLAAGAIDLSQLVQIYQQAGQPLTDEQMTILTKGVLVPAADVGDCHRRRSDPKHELRPG